MGKRNYIDEIIKEKLHNYSHEPSGDIWNRLDAELHPEDNIVEPKPISTLKRYGIATLLLFCISFIAFLSIQTGDEKTATLNGPIPGETKISENITSPSNKQQNPLVTGVTEYKYPVKTLVSPADHVSVATEKQIFEKSSFNADKESAIPVSQSTIATNDLSQKKTFGHADAGNINEINEVIQDIPASEEYALFIEPSQEEIDNIHTSENTVFQNKNIADLTPPAENTEIAFQADPIPQLQSKYFTADNNYQGTMKRSYAGDIENYSTRINLKGMSIGMAASYNQTSLLENGNIFKGEKPIQPALKSGTSKGISLAYNFSNSFGIQVDYIYNAVQGQNYILSEEDQIIQRSLSLYYNQIPLTFKLKVPRISQLTNRPLVTNYVAGVQYGMLSEYRIPQEKRLGDPDDLFTASEVAFVLGIDYDIYVGKKAFFSLGARTSISNDISTHQYPLDDFSKRNFVFGLRGSFNYMFRDY
ncbi:MAG: hypothetical protein H7X71_03460 [Chitinophagales bacterium]|nr:hypothetical protein [Chitinophagales bacterium]